MSLGEEFGVGFRQVGGGFLAEHEGKGEGQSNLSGDTVSIEAPQNLLRTKRIF